MKRIRVIASTVLLMVLLSVAVQALAQPSVEGSWTSKPSWPFAVSHAALLPDGRVLLWNHLGAAPQIWDPVGDTFASAQHPGSPLAGSRGVQLANGKIAVVGGRGFMNLGSSTVWLFHPDGPSWTTLPNLNQGREGPAVLLASDSRVFALGGDQQPGLGAEIPERALPGNAWSQVLGAALILPKNPWAFTLPTGLVVVVGPDATTRTMNESTQQWSVVDDMLLGGRTAGSAVLIPGSTDRFLIAGGRDPATATCEVIDLGNGGGWQSTGSMAYARRHHNLTLLADGDILATGGTLTGDEASFSVLHAEQYDTQSGLWTTLQDMSVSRRAYSVALLLPDATVLVAGGGDGSAGSELHADAAIFSPPYLFQGPRPVITAAPDSIRYKDVFTVSSPEASNIEEVWFVRAGAVTAGFNSDQRAIPLSFSAVPGELTINAPDSSTTAIPGTHMLFLVDDGGVPSQAAMVHMSDGPPAIPLPNIVTSAPTTGQVGTTYIYLCQASGGTPISWSLTQAPSWMAVNPVSGIVVGVPDQDGTFDVTIRATNVEGFDEQSWQVTIDPSNEPPVTVVPLGALWKYFKGNQDPGADWAELSYDDSNWLEGISGFGRNDNDDATVLDDMKDNYTTVFTRIEFPLSAAASVSRVSVLFDYDDGFAVYLNGTRICERRAPATITYQSTSTSSHEATGIWERDDFVDAPTLGLLQNGINVLAAVGLNTSISNGDLTLKIELELTGGGTTAVDASEFPVRIPVRVLPNPFMGSTRVLFAMRQAGVARLEVFDVHGRRVYVQEQMLPSGPRLFAWDGRDLSGRATAPGIYLYRLQGPDLHEVGKMTRLSPISR